MRVRGRVSIALAMTIAYSLTMAAQADLWNWVRQSAAQKAEGSLTQEAMLTATQQQSIVRLLRRQPLPQPCEFDDPGGEWLNHLRYRSVALSATRPVFLAEAGDGCARGGQGSNGALWLIRFDGGTPVLLAGSQEDFNGFLYAIEPAPSKQLRDIVLGWHMSAYDVNLTYFRFDGSRYRPIGRAALHVDDAGVSRISPQSPTSPAH